MAAGRSVVSPAATRQSPYHAKRSVPAQATTSPLVRPRANADAAASVTPRCSKYAMSNPPAPDSGRPSVPPSAVQTLARAFTDFGVLYPAQQALAAEFVDLLGDAEDPFERARLAGHFTASALVISGDGAHTLLTHHRKLGMWLQPGGHADGDRDLARVALRETEEETGLAGVTVQPGIFDLDRHWIPEHKGVPGHWHYDVRYVVRAGSDETFAVSEESHALAWMPLRYVADDDAYDASLRRMARRWLEVPAG